MRTVSSDRKHGATCQKPDFWNCPDLASSPWLCVQNVHEFHPNLTKRRWTKTPSAPWEWACRELWHISRVGNFHTDRAIKWREWGAPREHSALPAAASLLLCAHYTPVHGSCQCHISSKRHTSREHAVEKRCVPSLLSTVVRVTWHVFSMTHFNWFALLVQTLAMHPTRLHPVILLAPECWDYRRAPLLLIRFRVPSPL